MSAWPGRRPSMAALLVLLVVAQGCGEPDPVDTGTAQPPLELRPGAWQLELVALLENDCALETLQGETGEVYEMELAWLGDGSFELFHPRAGVDGADVSYPCVLDGDSFDCEEQLVVSDDFEDWGVKAVVEGRRRYWGLAHDASSVTGNEQQRVACYGADCDWVEQSEPFPCSFTYEVEGAAVTEP